MLENKATYIELPNEEENPIEDYAKSMILLNEPHEVTGSFGYDFDGIDEEISFTMEDIPNLSSKGYNTDERIFNSIKEAYEDEMKFSKECLTDYLRYNVVPHLKFKNKEEKYAFNKTTKSIINEAVAVEMSIYPGNTLDPNPHVVFIHDEDWEAFLFGLLTLPPVLKAVQEREHDFGLLTGAARYKNLIPSE